MHDPASQSKEFSDTVIGAFVEDFLRTFATTSQVSCGDLSLTYVGLLLDDRLRKDYFFPKHEGKQASVYFSPRLEYVFAPLLQRIEDNELPSLTSILVRSWGCGSALNERDLILTLGGQFEDLRRAERVVVTPGAEALSELLGIKDSREQTTVDEHFSILSQIEDHFIAFLPLSYALEKRPLFYVTVVGKGVASETTWKTIRQTVEDRLKAISFDLLGARSDSLGSEMREHAVRAARAAIMSRNFSHNVGSHSLANPRLCQSVGISQLNRSSLDSADLSQIGSIIQRRLETFHSYAQGRLDFLARAISRTGHNPEPLFFLNDVMEGGFFRQEVLLDTLIQDAGFDADQIKFHVWIQKADKSGFGKVTYEWPEGRDAGHQFICDKSGIDDVLVGIPEGMIGAHALFAFLENVMRNAVKYRGDRLPNQKQSSLELFLRLEEDQAFQQDKAQTAWILTIWDNLSSDEDGKIAASIRDNINTSLIDLETGEMRTKGHGIQEMKLCATILSGGEQGLRFPVATTQGGLDQQGDQERSAASREHYDYGEGKADGEGIKVNPSAIRCYAAPHEETDKGKWLTYNLLIPIPVILGIVTSPERAAKAYSANLPAHIRYFSSVQQLAESGSHIGVILDSEELKVKDTLDQIGRFHPCLPFRLMLVTDEKAEGGKWDPLLATRKSSRLAFKYPEHIPERRVRFCNNETGKFLLQILAQPQSLEANHYLGAGGEGNKRWEAIALRVYDAWLRAYKGGLPPLIEAQMDHALSKSPRWKLCIGFQRGGESLAIRWAKLLHAFNETDGPCVAIYVLSKNKPADRGTSTFSPNWPRDSTQNGISKAALDIEQNKSYSDKELLIFDNHGEIFSRFEGDELSFERGARFYQKMGLKDGLTVFQSFASPPSSSYGFGLFIYSIVEAALTRVVVIDERVAQASLDEKGRAFRGKERRFHSSGIFPLLSVRTSSEPKSPEFISERLRQAANATKNSWLAKDSTKERTFHVDLLWDRLILGEGSEGLTFGPTTCQAIAVHNPSVDNSWDQLETVVLHEPDVLIVHEGVIDHLAKVNMWREGGDQIWSLFHCAPTVVRTSGRGRESRHRSTFLPFLEFTDLSENTYRNLNKPGLVKGLLGAIGDVNQLPKDEGYRE